MLFTASRTLSIFHLNNIARHLPLQFYLRAERAPGTFRAAKSIALAIPRIYPPPTPGLPAGRTETHFAFHVYFINVIFARARAAALQDSFAVRINQ